MTKRKIVVFSSAQLPSAQQPNGAPPLPPDLPTPPVPSRHRFDVSRTVAALRFDELYEENKDVLNQATSHPVNSTSLNQWWADIAANGGPLAQILARVVVTGIQHIGFSQFTEAIRMGAMEACAKSLDTDKPIVLYIPSLMTKSNFWVSLLAWPYLRRRVCDVINNHTIGRYRNHMESYIFLLADDASFSGEQLTKYSLIFQTPFINQNDELFYLLAGVSRNARNLLMEAHQMRTPGFTLPSFPHSATRLRSIWELSEFVLSPADCEQLRRAIDMSDFGDEDYLMSTIHANTTLAYFDHKLPDTLSTFTPLFVRALAPQADGRIKVYGLITGCDPAEVGEPPYYENKGDVPFGFDEYLADHCPNAYYKSIRYTHKGLLVANLTEILQS